MGIIGIGREVVHVTGEGNLWVPQDDKFDGLFEVWNARAKDRKKHPNDSSSIPKTMAELVRPYVRLVKAMGVRPNPDDPDSVAKLSAVLTYLGDEVWQALSFELGDAIPATPSELAGRSRGDGSELWRKHGDRVVSRVESERRPCWGTNDQWSHAIRQAAWKLLGIPADSWEPPAPPPARLKDLLAGSPAARPATRLRDLLGGGN
jgi:hypothetical protein